MASAIEMSEPDFQPGASGPRASAEKPESQWRNQWLPFLIRRLISLGIILIVLQVFSSSLVRFIPGDPAVAIGGLTASPAEIAAIRESLGLNEPLSSQLVESWRDLSKGDLGSSFMTRTPVTTVIRENMKPSFQLAAFSLSLVMLVSIPAGMAAAAFTFGGRHRRGELGFIGTTSVVGAMPEYFVATVLAYIFAVSLGLLPISGYRGVHSLVLPMLAVSLRPIAVLSRLVRVETLNVLSSDYVRTARSKRLSSLSIYRRHVLPNVITAALSVGGILFAGIVGGAVVVENVFALPGLGTQLINAVIARDYPVIQGVILVLGVVVVIANAVVDLFLAIIDPRSISRDV